MGKDLGDIALNLLTDLLGGEVIAIGPPRSPLPVTGNLLPLRLKHNRVRPGRKTAV